MKFLSRIFGKSPSDRNVSGNETMQKLGESSEEAEKELTEKEYIDLHKKLSKESWQAARRGDKERDRELLKQIEKLNDKYGYKYGIISHTRRSAFGTVYDIFEECDVLRFRRFIHRRQEESENIDEEAEKLKAKSGELLRKPDTDPKVTQTVEFINTMTGEVLHQKSRLTQSRPDVTGKEKTEMGYVATERKNGTPLPLNSEITGKHSSTLEPGPSDPCRTENASTGSPCCNTRQFDARGEGKSTHDTGVVQRGVTNSSGSVREVCSDVRKYLKQITGLVEEKIQSLPEDVREKLESVIQGFQRLIAGMWKLLLYDLLLYELTRLFTSSLGEHINISRKKGRLKYGFQLAAMLALWLSHDVESNPGPMFDVRSCLERMTRRLSEIVRHQLPVEGSLWSESVAEAAYAAGYSTDCQWTNPSGNSKDKMTPLIERATELGRLLTEMDCLPSEFAPFIKDLGNNEVQEQLVNHYKVEHYMSAVDIVLGVSGFSDAQKQDILQQLKTLEKKMSETSNSTQIQVLRYSRNPSADFGKLADSSASQPVSGCQNVVMKRKAKRQRVQQRKNPRYHAKAQKSQISILTVSDSSVQPECNPVIDVSDSSCIDLPEHLDMTQNTDTDTGQDITVNVEDLLKLNSRDAETSTNSTMFPGAELSRATVQPFQSHFSIPVTGQEENEKLKNITDALENNSNMTTVQNIPEDVLSTDPLTLLHGDSMSSSEIQSSTTLKDHTIQRKEAKKTTEMADNLHPATNDQGILELLDFLLDQTYPWLQTVSTDRDVNTSSILSKAGSDVTGYSNINSDRGQDIESFPGAVTNDHYREEDMLGWTNSDEEISNESYAVPSVSQHHTICTLSVTDSNANVTKPTHEESTDTSMETSEHRTEANKQTTSESATEQVDNRVNTILVDNQTTSKAEDNASEEFGKLVYNSPIPKTLVDHERPLSLDECDTGHTTSVPEKLDGDKGQMTWFCISAVSDYHNGDDILNVTCSDDIARDTQLENQQTVDHSETTSDINTEQGNLGGRDENIAENIQHKPPECTGSAQEIPCKKRESNKSGCGEDNTARSNEAPNMEQMVASMNTTATRVTCTVGENQFAMFKASLLNDVEKEIDTRWETFKATGRSKAQIVESSNDQGQREPKAENRKRRSSFAYNITKKKKK